MAEGGLLLSLSFPGCCESNHEWESKGKHRYDMCEACDENGSEQR